MLAASTPTFALEYLQKRLLQCQGEASAALRGLLALISPARPDSAEALGTILRESGIWERLESAVGTMVYNPERTALRTPEEAIQHVGLERVHKLAVSLLINRCFQLQVPEEDRRELEVLALASGFLARELARRQEIVDPDFGMICALLRNFGRLMISSLLCEDRAEALALGVAADEEDRYVAIFGVSPTELSHDLFRASELPESLAIQIAGAPSYLTTAAPLTYEEEVIRLTDFALKVCALSITPGGRSAQFSTRVDRLLEDLDMPPSLTGWNVETMLMTVMQQLAVGSSGRVMAPESRETTKSF